ncbi:MAG: hypothetical protein EOO43_07300 [Flavobacterium sp.]|nr:MAG: hypothetical protein EOO43_07300 [Flavobacterium sp.]
MRLDNLKDLSQYIDSFYKANYPNRTYPGVVSEVLRKRFYHGYSLYNTMSNPSASFFQKFLGNGATAVVIPDDILKYANAACSQQSIVSMEIFQAKGYQ